jgi:hypothetical protein
LPEKEPQALRPPTGSAPIGSAVVDITISSL